MNGLWRDNTPFVYGATGNSSSSGATSILTDYCFPGLSDSLNWGTGGIVPPYSDWSEQSPLGPGSSANPLGDRRLLAAMGPITFQAFGTYNFTIAHITGRSTSGTGNNVNELFAATDQIRSFYSCAENVFDGNCGSSTVNINNNQLPYNINLYPNPTNGYVHFSSVKPIYKVTLYNIMGKEIITLNNLNIQSIDLSAYESGIYFLHLITNDQHYVVKQIVKN